MNKIEKLVGQRIAYLRKLSGITQESLAEKVNVSRDSLSRVERGTSGISLSNLKCIAMAMNVPIKELFTFEEKSDDEQLIESMVVLLRNQEKEALRKWHGAFQILFQ